MWFWKRKSQQQPAATPSLKVAIDPDDYHARDVGWTSNDRQFFLTTPFEPAIGGSLGCEYLALYVFDSAGLLVDSQIMTLGVRDTFDEDEAQEKYAMLKASLGVVEHRRVELEPFHVEYDGKKFGLILREPEDDDDCYAVEVQPGNYMAFFEPWDSGDYDT